MRENIVERFEQTANLAVIVALMTQPCHYFMKILMRLSRSPTLFAAGRKVSKNASKREMKKKTRNLESDWLKFLISTRLDDTISKFIKSLFIDHDSREGEKLAEVWNGFVAYACCLFRLKLIN